MGGKKYYKNMSWWLLVVLDNKDVRLRALNFHYDI